MQPFRQTSLVQQPDGEIIRAVLDAATLPDEDGGIQFDLGMLGLKIAQSDQSTRDLQNHEDSQISLPAITKAPSDNPSKGLTITTTRKSITSYQPAAQPGNFTPKHVQQPRPGIKSDLPLSLSPGRRDKARKEALPTVSSVSPDAIPGLRRQASAVDPEQAKQREKGWGLSFKDPAAAIPTRKEIEVSPPQADDLGRVRQITQEKEALAQQRARAEQARQEAEAEQHEAAKQAKAAARRAALEAAAAQRAEEARKRHEFMQETKKMYRAALQQEEQHTPAFLRMQQEAQAKEAEEEAEKRRVWEEEIASKKFWFKDIQGTLEPAVPRAQSPIASEGQTHESSATPGDEASSGHLQGEASQGSVGTASPDEQKKKSRREWQQSLRNSNKFKSADASRGPWGLSTHSSKTERRLKYHQMRDAGCDPMEPTLQLDSEDCEAEPGSKLLDPLDDSNSLSDLARSLHPVQPSPTQSSSADSAFAESASTQLAAHGPLVQLMHHLTKPAESQQAAAAAAAHAEAADASVTHGGSVNHAAAISLPQPPYVGREAEVSSIDEEEASMQRVNGATPAGPQGHLETCLQYDGLHAAGKQADSGIQQPSQDCMTSSSAQDFFKGRG